MRTIALLAASALTPDGLRPAAAQTGTASESQPSERRGVVILSVLAGAATALGLHEGSHLAFDLAFDADPRLKKVSFHGLPFFAIAHRPDLSPRREFTVSSAGFWSQHATSEWLLTRRPNLRRERAPFAKGVLAFDVVASLAYSGAAFARTGPPERDTRGMAASRGVDERWIGALVAAPAALDAYRYFDPDARWAVWASRAVKIGGVLLILRGHRDD